MSSNEYANAIQDIWRYLIVNLVPLIVLGAILITIALIGLYQKAFKRIIIILMIAFALIIIAYAIIEMSLFNYDLKHQTFEEYKGSFEYRTVLGNEKDILNLNENSKVKIRTIANFDIPWGEYDGSIWYGKYSKWAVNIQVEEILSQ